MGCEEGVTGRTRPDDRTRRVNVPCRAPAAPSVPPEAQARKEADLYTQPHLASCCARSERGKNYLAPAGNPCDRERSLF